jgi:cell division protein FtsL
MRNLNQLLNYKVIILLLLVGILMLGLGLAAGIHSSREAPATASGLVAPGQAIPVAFFSPIVHPNGYAWGD